MTIDDLGDEFWIIRRQVYRQQAEIELEGHPILPRPESVEAWHGYSAAAADERVKNVRVSDDVPSVALMDGRTNHLRSLCLVPSSDECHSETTTAREMVGAGYGIHRPAMDEDLSTEELLQGAPAPNMKA